MKTDVVMGVVCFDSASLLLGYIVAESFRGLPVVTSDPDDWASETATHRRSLTGEVRGFDGLDQLDRQIRALRRRVPVKPPVTEET